MECPHCSNEVFEGDTYCNVCGEDLPRPDEAGSHLTRCLSCGKMHTNEGFRCDLCIAKENWKPEDWEKYRTAPAIPSMGPWAKVMLFASTCLVGLFLVTMVTAREVKMHVHGQGFHWAHFHHHHHSSMPMA